METILYIILIVCGTAFLLLFGLLLFSSVLFTSRSIFMPVACAGKAEVGMLYWRRGLSMYSNEYVKPDGDQLPAKDYKSYVTRGESMRLCGIREGAVLLVKRGYRFDEQAVVFPKIMLLRRDKQFTREWKDVVLMWLCLKPGHKVRRAWSLLRVGTDDVDAVLERIGREEAFCFLRNRPEFMGWDEMKKNFKECKLEKYKNTYIGCENADDVNHVAIISTTLHKKGNKIMFSIHPIRVIEGEVACFYNVTPDTEPDNRTPQGDINRERVHLAS